MNYAAYFKAAQELEIPFTKACVMLYDLHFAESEASVREKDLFVAYIEQYKY